MFKCLSLYEKASGAKLDKAKTKTNPLNLRYEMDKVFGKTVGVYHGYNIDEDALWLNKIDKIKTSLNVWKPNVSR